MISFPLLALLALPFPGGATAHAAGTPREEVLAALEGLARPHILTLRREVHSYHYRKEDTGKARYYSPDHPRWLDSVNAGTQTYFHNPKFKHYVREGTMSWLGNGFYTAMDPAVSRSYASPRYLDSWKTDYSYPWVMYRIALPAGTRLLDVPFDGKEISGKHVVLLRDALDCDLGEDYRPRLFQMFLMSSSKRHGCRRLLNELLERLDISAILYSFVNKLATLPSCKNAPERAMIMTGRLPKGSVRAFSEVLPNAPDGAEKERLAIQSIYQLVDKDLPLLWPALKTGTPGGDEADTYASQHLLGCGDHPEETLQHLDTP